MDATMKSGAERARQTIQVADLALLFRDVVVSIEKPTGAQLAEAAGFGPELDVSVLEVLANGELNEVRQSEAINLRNSSRKFVIATSDRLYKLSISGIPTEWPARIISGAQLRKLAQVPQENELLQELPDDVQRVISDHDLIDLGAPGVEKFSTRARLWELNVQGVLLKVHHPTIVVRQAIKDAGFDPGKSWIIVLRVLHQPKREVRLDEVIDLRMEGIEKLRLTPKEVNNGEAPTAIRRAFNLLDVDERFLDSLKLQWETVVDTSQANHSRRWLLIHHYPVPAAYTVRNVSLALEIPLTYPGAQIDMFYTNPPLILLSGRPIPNTESSEAIVRAPFNRWSRHRGLQSPWDPASDNVATHLALVESAILKEIEE